jgi:hypothetical protein
MTYTKKQLLAKASDIAIRGSNQLEWKENHIEILNVVSLLNQPNTHYCQHRNVTCTADLIEPRRGVGFKQYFFRIL